MKQLIRFSLLLLVLLLPATAKAYDFKVDGIYYDINGNEATVIGYSSDNYTGEVNIPETVTYNGTTYSVTSIGDKAFEFCFSLTSVTIPNSVTSIGGGAFHGCSGLTSITVASSNTTFDSRNHCNAIIETASNMLIAGCKTTTIPNSVTSIGDGAFYGCRDLKSITIPNSVTSIGSLAFRDCLSLTNVTIPNSVTSIGRLAFYDCFSLTSVTIPNSVTSIGGYTFYDCSGLTRVTIGNSVISIGEYAFYGCSGLTNVTIPNSVTSIGEAAFWRCSGLTSVTIGNSVTEIGNGAFSECSGLTSVTIPNSVTTIGDRAFKDCSGLTSVTIGNSVTSIGKDVFMGTPWYHNQPDGLVYAGLVAYKYKGTMPNGTNITIRDGTLGIAGYAFYGCSGLASVTIPNSVSIIGDWAFSDCSGLTSITVASGNSTFDSRSNCNAIIETASNTMIAGCKATIIPNTVTAIGGNAFYGCSGLTSVTIPNSVISIGGNAFSGCSGLTSVTIPNSVTYIGDYAFYDCSGLISMTISNSVTTIGNYVFYGCRGLTSIDIPNTVISIGDYAFSRCSGLTSVDIPNSVTSIGWSAFEYCFGLTSVTIGNSVTDISADAFRYCSSLTSVTIPNSVISIGGYAFSCCSGLTSMIIGNSVTSIGYAAFHGCSGLTSITVASSNTTFDSRKNCNAIIKTASNTLIAGCKATIIPNSVTSIGNSAFSGCSGLTSIDIPNSVTTIGSWAFSGCRGLNDVYCYIEDPALINLGDEIFDLSSGNYLERTLHVPVGSVGAYQNAEDWSRYFGSIVEMAALNYLSLNDTTAFYGDTIVIPVAMTNKESIIAFQTDIFLPEGLEIVKEDGEYVIEPSERMTSTHSIMSNAVSNGSVRVICFSSNYVPFTGVSGDDLFYITVKVADDAEGDYTIELKNTLLTNSAFVDLAAPDASAVISVQGYIMGDANNSGTVTVTDIVSTAQYVLELNPVPFVFASADMNGDGSITVSDIMLIANLILNQTINMPRRIAALTNSGDRMGADEITLATGETRIVSIYLNNDIDYSAFQLDLTLPDGLTANNFALTNRTDSHFLEVNTLSNGKTRTLCYSPGIEAFDGHSGALLTFDITATELVEGAINVDGIELVTDDCRTVLLAPFGISVNGGTTGISQTTAAREVASVEYYNLAGQRIDRPDSGVTLIVTTYTDGSRTTSKIIQ